MIDCMTLLSIVSISLPMLLYMQCTAVTKCSLNKRFFLCIFSAKAKGEIQALKTLRKQAFSNAARAAQPWPVPPLSGKELVPRPRGSTRDGGHPLSLVEPCGMSPAWSWADPCVPAAPGAAEQHRAPQPAPHCAHGEPGWAVQGSLGSSHSLGVAAPPSATL